MRKISGLITVAAVFTAMLFQGCSFNINLDNNGINVDKTADLSDELQKGIDTQVLSYDKRTSDKYSTSYRFLIESESTEGLGDEIKTLYDNTNELLAGKDFEGEKIQIQIGYQSHPNAITLACIMANFTDKNDNNGQDRITKITINGIDDDFSGYDKYGYYEVNDLDYWSAFNDVELAYYDYVTYQDYRMKDGPEINAVGNRLEERFGDYLDAGKVYVYENAVHTIWFELPVTIDQSKIDASGEYASTTEFIEAVRNETNVFRNENPDNGFLDYRVKIVFNTDDGNTWGSFSNFLKDDHNTHLEEFSAVDYFMAPTEELAACKGIIEVDVKRRELDEVIMIVENMEGLKYVESIQYVKNIQSEQIDELKQKYTNIVFD